MKEISIKSKIVGRAVDSTTASKGGAMPVDLSAYLPKSVWEKVFKLVTDEAGNEHIFANLPFASKYGITMFANDGSLNLPNIYDGLPIDWQTIYWEDVKDADGNVTGRVLKASGGGGEGGTVNGITLEQLEAYLGVNKYATQTWVEGKGYLSAITSKLVTDALGFTPYDSAKLSGELGKYLPLEGGRIDGKLGIGCTPTVFVDIFNSSKNTNTFVHTRRGDTGYGISFGIGSGGVNRGLYDDNLNRWIIYSDDVKTNITQDIWINQDEWNGGLKLNRNTSGGGCGISVYSNGVELGQFGIAGNGRFEYDVISDGVNGTKFYIKSDGDGFVEGSFSMKSAKINGGNLTYNASKKYWKLEGDLLVTGGISMFSSDSAFTPSVVMDGVVVDGVTIKKDPTTKALYVDGDISGGLKEVYWSDIRNKPTFASVATSGKYSDLSGVPTLLSSFTDDVVKGKYLPLVGGMLSNTLSFKSNIYKDAGGAIDLNNSDIINVNAIYTSDLANNGMEGILFKRTNERYDSIWASDGVLRFSIDGDGVGTFTNDVIVLHSDNYTSYTNRLVSAFGKSVSNNMENRPTSANNIYTDKSLRYYLATSSMITGKPMADGCILHCAWDNAGWNSQLYIPNTIANKIQFRGSKIGGAATEWGDWVSLIDENGGVLAGDLLLKNTYTTCIGSSDSSLYAIYTGIVTSANANNLYLIVNNTLGSNKNIAFGIGTKESYEVWGRWSATGLGIGIDNAAEKLDIVNSKASTNTFVHTKRTDTGYGISFGIGSDGVNRGLYDDNLNRWIIYADSSGVNLSKDVWITQDAWSNGLNLNRSVAGGGASIAVWSNGTHIGNFGINGSKQFEFNNVTNGVAAVKFTVDGDGNGLFYGGITMYSDIRKKTKLQEVELSLQQIADAPLIEHYYNSDEKRTTHVGSIAQYWASMNDWFCKLDGEGYYTMEIQNAALASAISIARELQRYESKTDKKIRLLKKRIGELEDEIEKLKKA